MPTVKTVELKVETQNPKAVTEALLAPIRGQGFVVLGFNLLVETKFMDFDVRPWA